MPDTRSPRVPDEQAYLLAQTEANLAFARKYQDPALWGETIWAIKGDQTRPYRLKDYPFLMEIISSKAPMTAVQSAAQVGKSEAYSIACMSWADWGYNCIHAFDTDGKANEFVRERINPNIQQSKYLAKRCADTDNVGQKRIGNGFIYYRGATESKAVSVSADFLVLDELDLMAPDVVRLYEKRLRNSRRPMCRKTSNPSFPGEGINAEYKQGDQRQWYVQCPACAKWEPVTWLTHVKDLQFVCPHCHRPMDRMAAVRAGRWVATNAMGKFPSYLITGLLAPVCDIAQIHEGLTSPDQGRVRATWRMDLGLPYEDKTAGLTAEEVYKLGRSYQPCQRGVLMVVDPGSRFDVQLWAHTHGSTPTMTYSGTVSGWAELRELERQSGAQFGVIDNGPELDATREWCAARPGRWARVSYALNGDSGSRWKLSTDQAGLVLANRTLMMDHLAGQVRQGGYNIPAEYSVHTARYCQHLQASKRLIERGSDGVLKVVWREGSDPDHQAHCTVYALIGLELFGQANACGASSSGGRYSR